MQSTHGRGRCLMLPEALVVLAMFTMLAIAFAGLFLLANAQATETQDQLAIIATVADHSDGAQVHAAESQALPAPEPGSSYSRVWDVVTIIGLLALAILALTIAPARQYPIPHKRKHHYRHGSGSGYLGSPSARHTSDSFPEGGGGDFGGAGSSGDF